jgi:hypothetical protein
MANEIRPNSSRNTARASLKVGSFQADLEVNVTPRGLMAIGFLVSSILVSVSPIILAATGKLPEK